MKYNMLLKRAESLPFDAFDTIYTYMDTSIALFRPSVLSKRFVDYDVNKNLQIWLFKEGKQFRPSHLRILLDLKLRVMNKPEAKNLLLKALDEIYYGEDPFVAIQPLNSVEFSYYIEELTITASLVQAMLLEQEVGYGSKSKFDPPSLFLQGWIRTFIHSDKDFDKLVYGICRNNPPQVKYTSKDNRKSKKYEQNASPLWYDKLKP